MWLYSCPNWILISDLVTNTINEFIPIIILDFKAKTLCSIIIRLAISVARSWRIFVYNLIASHLRKPNLRNLDFELAQPSHRELFLNNKGDLCVGTNRTIRKCWKNISFSSITGKPHWKRIVEQMPIQLEASFTQLCLKICL